MQEHINYQYPLIENFIYPKIPLLHMTILSIKDLIPYKIMEGRFLLGKVIHSENKLFQIHFEIQESEEIKIKGCIQNSKTQLLIGQFIAIKNPYLITTGEIRIRIEDRQDVILLLDYSAELLKYRKRIKYNPIQFKELGNQYFKDKLYTLSYECYTLALISNDPQLISICYNNRAQCLINLGYYPEAMRDLANVDQNNPKARYRYALIYKALGMLERALEYTDDPQMVIELNEQIKIKKGEFSLYHLVRDYANSGKIPQNMYIANVVRKASPLQGLGLFAEQDINKGQVIFMEPALSRVKVNQNNQLDHEAWDYLSYEMFYDLRDKCIENKHFAKKVFSMYDGTKRQGIDINERNFPYSLPTVCVKQQRLEKINEYDGHASEMDPVLTKGIWQYMAYCNHSINHNSLYLYMNEVLVVVAIKDIKKQEEILVSYGAITNFEFYSHILQTHKIPVEESLILQTHQYKVNQKFKSLFKLETSPNAILTFNEYHLLPILKDTYPFIYLKIIRIICNQLITHNKLDLALKYQQELIEYQLNEYPTQELLEELITLLTILTMKSNFDMESLRLSIKAGQLLFGESFMMDLDSPKVLLRFAMRQQRIKIEQV